MAAASMKEIKLRIRSVESTRQITKAMEMVASSKLRRAKQRAENGRPYFETVQAALTKIAAGAGWRSSVYVEERPVRRSCWVVIGGDRGLAGGYNNNVFKTALSGMEGSNCCVVPIGRRCAEFFIRRGYSIVTEEFAVTGEVDLGDCHELSAVLAQGFRQGDFDEVNLVYTRFVSVLSQQPFALPLLPIIPLVTETKAEGSMLYEPDPATVFDAIVPGYLAGVLWHAVCESYASEQGARRTAMDSASKNADAMIEGLSLHYNRARQAAITQEITEIVAGAGENV